uniref:SUZ domain-containing protein 1 n=1 Tax=Schistocephalus solidus TaxID=70667 RepID=A0A0X3Q042_SCHSO
MSQPPIRILRRPPIKVNNQVADNVQPTVPTKTLEQREADYAAARRRIMGSESEDQPTVPEGAGLSASATNTADNGPATKTTGPSDDSENQKQTSTKPPQTAIPLMSIPTAALSIHASLDRGLHATPRPVSAVQMPTKALCQTGVTQLSACGPVSSPKQQLPAFGSNLPHQSSTGLSSESPLSGLQSTNLGYQAAPHLFNNFSSNFLPSRNVANGAVLDGTQQSQPPNGHVDRSKTTATLNMSAMLHQLNLLRQYQQNIAACQLMQPMPSNSQVPLSSAYPAAYQRTTCNQVQNLMPSLHFQASPSRFTYSSGYN